MGNGKKFTEVTEPLNDGGRGDGVGEASDLASEIKRMASVTVAKHKVEVKTVVQSFHTDDEAAIEEADEELSEFLSDGWVLVNQTDEVVLTGTAALIVRVVMLRRTNNYSPPPSPRQKANLVQKVPIAPTISEPLTDEADTQKVKVVEPIPAGMGFAEALRRGYDPEALRALGNREAMTAGREVFARRMARTYAGQRRSPLAAKLLQAGN